MPAAPCLFVLKMLDNLVSAACRPYPSLYTFAKAVPSFCKICKTGLQDVWPCASVDYGPAIGSSGLATTSLGLRRRLRLGLRGIADGLGQHFAQLSLGLLSFGLLRLATWGLPFGHEQYVGMPEAESNPWLVAILSTGRLVSGRASSS